MGKQPYPTKDLLLAALANPKTKLMASWPLFFLLLLALVLSACQNRKGQQDKEERLEEEEVITVAVVAPMQGSIRRLLRFSGDVRPETEVRVFARVADRVSRLMVEEGDRVQRGAVLAEIRGEMLELAISQARASLDAAKVSADAALDDYQRLVKLHEAQVTSKAQLDASKARLDGARAQVEALKAGVRQTQSSHGETVIRSPMEGIVATRFVEQGDMVGPGVPLVSIIQMESVRIRVQLTEADFARVQKRMPVEVSVTSYPNRSFSGVVDRVSPTLDFMTRMGTAEVRIPNDEGLLRPGMFAQVQVVAEERDEVLLLPMDALVLDALLDRDSQGLEQYRAFVLEEDEQGYRARSIIVSVGLREGTQVEIVSGLEVDAQVIVKGQQFIRPDTRVRMFNEGGEDQEGAEGEGEQEQREVGDQEGLLIPPQSPSARDPASKEIPEGDSQLGEYRGGSMEDSDRLMATYHSLVGEDHR